MAQLIENYTHDKVFKNVKTLVKSLSPDEKVKAVTLVNITARKGKSTWKYILLGILVIIGIKLFEKIGEIIGGAVIFPLLEKIFTSEGTLYVVIGGIVAYFFYNFYRYSYPKTDVAVLTKKNIFLIEDIKASIHGVSSDSVVQVPLSSVKSFKEVPSNVFNSNWHLETDEEIPFQVWLDQKTLWDTNYRIGEKGTKLNSFIQTINPNYIEGKVSRVGGFRNLIVNIGFLITVAIPFVGIWAVYEIRKTTLEVIEMQKMEKERIEQPTEKVQKPTPIKRIPLRITNPNRIVVPNLANKTYREAKKILLERNLLWSAKAGIFDVTNNSAYNHYMVSSQTPTSKKWQWKNNGIPNYNYVKKNSIIKLNLRLKKNPISSNNGIAFGKPRTPLTSTIGSTQVAVPLLKDKTYKAAKRLLGLKGLKYKAVLKGTATVVTYWNFYDNYYVVSQTPGVLKYNHLGPANNKYTQNYVAKNSTVTVYLSKNKIGFNRLNY